MMFNKESHYLIDKMLEILTVCIDFLLARFGRLLHKFGTIQLRKVRICWSLLFQNYDSYCCRDMRLIKTERSGGWGSGRLDFYHTRIQKKTTLASLALVFTKAQVYQKYGNKYQYSASD